MNVSIIIPTYHRPDSLSRCVASVREQDYGEASWRLEIIIAFDSRDRGCADASKRYGKGKDIIIARARCPGVNAARNEGINVATGDILIFLDDDCLLPDKKWLLRAVNNFTNNPKAAAIGGRYRVGTNTRPAEHARNWLDNYYLDSGNRDGTTAEVLLGGNSGYRKEIFSLCGLFDEHIRFGAAETELQVRIRKNGGKIYVADNIAVFHDKSGERLFSLLKKSFQQGRGAGYIFRLHGDLSLPSGRRKHNGGFLFSAQVIPGGLFFRLAATGFLFFLGVSYQMGLRLERMRTVCDRWPPKFFLRE